MKKLLLAVSIGFFVLGLTACQDDPPIEREITTNITNGHTITQYVEETTIDLAGISFTDRDGNDLSDDIVVSGTYDLNAVGLYELTLSVTDEFDTYLAITVFLEIIGKTCETHPDMEGCPVPVTGFALSVESDVVDTILLGNFIKVNWVFTPSNADNQTVLIATSDESIATVNQYGHVFAQGPGEVTITFTTEDGGFSISKVYTVRKPTCQEDPLQDECVNTFLLDDSRLTTLADPNLSGTDYSAIYPNNRIYYEIFVRKFADSDGNYVGDFNGIIDTIPYLEQLGIGGLWLMPINDTTSDHGYDISDYYTVNPDYGTMADFEALLAAADQADIDIIMDLVVNHMGAHNDIFQDVLRNGTGSDYYFWFTWIDSSDSRANDTGSWGQTIWWNPTNRTWLRDGSYTIHYSLQDKMYFGYFSDWMPDLNLENPEVINYIYDVAEFWLNKGVHGFRMDATSHLYALHEYTSVINRNQENIDFLTAFYNHVTSVSSDAYVVIEAWEGYDVYIPYFASGVSAFNFQGSYWMKDALNGYLSNDIGSALDFLYDEIADYNANYIDSIFLSNHDMDRVSLVLGDDREMRQAAELLLTTRSNPFIYFGDEIGILGTRTNMVWGDYYDSLYAEFADRGVTPVDEQLANPDSLLNTYINVAQARNNSLALSYGDFIPYESTYLEGYFRVFEQGNDKELVVVLFNFTPGTTVPIPAEFTSYEILYSTFANNLGGVSPKGTVILRLPYDDLIDLTN